MRHLIILSYLLIIPVFYVFSQSNISFKLNTISYNFLKNENSMLYNSKITPNGELTFEPGIQVAYEFFGNSYTSFKIKQLVKVDACSKISGSTQIMIRGKFFSKWKSSFYIGVGPVLFYRDTWTSIDNYIENNFYSQVSIFDYRNIWLSGEIEYSYTINRNGSFAISLNHINGNSLGVTVGYKYWISRKPRRKCNCPSFN